MDAATYKIIHLTGIATLAIGTGGLMADGKNRKTFAIFQGIGLLVMLVSGFGMLAKLHLIYEAPASSGLLAKLNFFPHFAIVKIFLWVVIAMLPVLFRRLKTPLVAAILISLALVGIMAWLGVMKPALW